MNLVNLLTLLVQTQTKDDRRVLRDSPGCGQIGKESNKECFWGCDWLQESPIITEEDVLQKLREQMEDDDVGYVTNDIFALQNLLDLALMYCKQHHVTLRADKTKLQVFSNKNSNMQAYYAKVISPINMDGITVSFVEEAEHVGLIRSTSGNLPHILNRFTSHKRSLAAVLPVGLARGHVETLQLLHASIISMLLLSSSLACHH